MVNSAFCPKCSSPVLPGENFCAGCGARLAGGPGPDLQPSSTSAASAASVDPRLTALGMGTLPGSYSAPSGEPSTEGPAAAPVHVPAGWQVDLRPLTEAAAEPMPAHPAPDVEPGPAGTQAPHVPGGYLAPSATYRGSGWALPKDDTAGPSERAPGSSLGASIGATPIAPSAGGPQPLPDSKSGESVAAAAVQPATPPQAFGAVPAVAGATAAGVASTPRKESVQELVAFGLVAAGAVVGFASLFLPWAGPSGIGIGTVALAASPPQPNQWAWGMPAAIPLFLLTALVLGAAAGSDRAQLRLPTLATVIARTTDMVLPMLLGGIYLGVGLLYMTLPPQFGYGTGVLVLTAGGCLLVAGSVVALFFPPKEDRTGA